MTTDPQTTSRQAQGAQDLATPEVLDLAGLSRKIFHVEYIACGLVGSSDSIGESEDDVRSFYEGMNSENEPMVVLSVTEKQHSTKSYSVQ